MLEESEAVEAVVNVVLELGVGLVALEVGGVTGMTGGFMGGVTVLSLGMPRLWGGKLTGKQST